MYLWITSKIFYEILILRTLLIYNLKLKLFILITLVDFAELLTDFSYTNFTIMHWTDSVFTWTLSCSVSILRERYSLNLCTENGNVSKTKRNLIQVKKISRNCFRR